MSPTPRTVTVTEHQVGKTRFEKLDVDAARVASQPALIDELTRRADRDLVLDVRLVGVRPDELDLHPDEIESARGAARAHAAGDAGAAHGGKLT